MYAIELFIVTVNWRHINRRNGISGRSTQLSYLSLSLLLILLGLSLLLLSFWYNCTGKRNCVLTFCLQCSKWPYFSLLSFSISFSLSLLVFDHCSCSGCDTLFPSLMLLEHHKEEFEHWSDEDDDDRPPCCRRNRDDYTDTDSFTSEAESEDLERLL